MSGGGKDESTSMRVRIGMKAAVGPEGGQDRRPRRHLDRPLDEVAGAPHQLAQLRGRAGRQGDPGLSRFYLCLEDDLLRIFGPDTLFSKMMNSNLEDGEAIGSKWLSKAIETAQKKVEARNYEIRKQVVQYDDVMNDQRKVIYEQRAEIMDSEAVDDVVVAMRHDAINSLVSEACPPGSYPEQWDIEGLKTRVDDVLAFDAPIEEWVEEDQVEPEMIEERLVEEADRIMDNKIAAADPALWRRIEKSVLLQELDGQWKDHLATLDANGQRKHRTPVGRSRLPEHERQREPDGQCSPDQHLGDAGSTSGGRRWRRRPRRSARAWSRSPARRSTARCRCW